MNAQRCVVFPLIALCAWVLASGLAARPVKKAPYPYKTLENTPKAGPASLDESRINARQGASILAQYNFDGQPGSCDDEGWASVDLTTIQGFAFHIDNSVGLDGGHAGKLAPIAGNQSLWCGTHEDPSGACAGCYPGYGNDWSECWESRTFSRSGDVTVSYEICWDSEPGYDFTYVQYWDGVGWNTIQQYDGTGGPIVESYVVPDLSLPPNEVKLRFLFESDAAWSNEDGLWCPDGAVIIDNLQVSATGSGVIDFQDFESELPLSNVTSDGDWSACNSAYGDFAGLFENPLQEDPCTTKRCTWGFYNGSTATIPNGTHPAVPYVDASGQYLTNEIWSPAIPFSGTGSQVTLEFCVYRDLPLDALVFYVWHIRTSPDGVCWSSWCDKNLAYSGTGKRWDTVSFDVSDCITPGAQYVQIALGAWDLCEVWCGVVGSGTGHTHAPLLDNVTLYREEPSCDIVWQVQGANLFHDRFPDGGVGTGTVRVDRFASDVALANVIAGAGLKTVSPGRPAVYLHVRELPGKNAAAIEDPAYPFQSYVSSGGFAKFLGNPTGNPNQFEFDVQDAVFESGDVVEFYFSAEDINNCVSYWSEFTSAVPTEAAVEAAPMEMTCMPGPGALINGGDILYVDNYEGLGAQPFFDSAFLGLNIDTQVDRYDVRLPGANGSTPGADVTSAVAQLIPYYNVIIWSSGSRESGNINEADWGMLTAFLDNHPNGGGLYLSADNLACEWAAQTSVNAVAARNYMKYRLDCCHRELGISGSPFNYGLMPLTIFQENASADYWVLTGGCPQYCCFDVLSPVAPAVTEAFYENTAAFGSVLSQETINQVGQLSKVKLSGFSLHKMRDPVPAGIPARTLHLGRILQCLGTILNIPVAVGETAPQWRTALGQNYPNPFNPVTTIEYSLAERTHVTVDIFDVGGRRVRTLLDAEQPPAATHTVTWDGRNDAGRRVTTGVYFYRLSAGAVINTRKMILLK